jgi:YHS domain-containing protein
MIEKLTSLFAILAIASFTVIAEDVNLEGIKCVVAPKDAQASKSADYKDAKVFFCCGNCAGKFTSDPSKFAEKANAQLVSTKQYEQKACPFSGGDLNAETAITVAGAKVAFCCNNCKGKAEKAKDDEQLKLVFNDKAFEKGFKKVEAKK